MRDAPLCTWLSTILLVPLAAIGLCACSASPSANRPVILITVDTLRADALGTYGSPPLPSPNLDRIGAEGAVMASTFAPVPRTTQSVATILTGLHPLSHGSDGLGMPLAAELRSIAEVFSDEGFETAAFVTNVNLMPGYGFEQGFQLYSNPESRWKANSADSLTNEAIAWLEGRDADKPFLLWVHYLDPHWPYTPDPSWTAEVDPGYEPPFRIDERQADREVSKGEIIYRADEVMDARQIEHVRRLYFAEVAATDAAIGRLLEQLREQKILDRSIVVMTSDHGESLGEHRYWFAHGEYLYDQTLWVPWFVRAPGLVPAGTVVKGVAVLEDVAPTLLGLSGIAVPDDLDGLDLSSMMRGGGSPEIAPRTLVHLADWLHIHPENPRHAVKGREGRWTAVRENGKKLLRIPVGPGQVEDELYDLRADSGETTNLAGTDRAMVESLRQRLESISGSYRKRAEVDPSEPNAETREVLRGLGYVN